MKPDFFSFDFQKPPPPLFPGTKNERRKSPPLGGAQGTGVADMRYSRKRGMMARLSYVRFGVQTAMAMKAEVREKIGLRGVFLP